MSEKSKRRWFQYSLRTLLVLVLVVSLPCSWLAVKIRQKEKERQAVEEIENLGGIVFYDYQYQGTEAPGPAWMRKLLGDDFFSDVVSVDLVDCKVTDDGFQHLEGSTNLWSLHLSGTQLTDEGLQHLTGLTNLQYLLLADTQTTPEGIKKLQQALPNCDIEYQH